MLEIGHVGIYKFRLLKFWHFLMNRKGAIFIKEFTERWIIVRVYGPQS